MVNTIQQRNHDDFVKLVYNIQAAYLKRGKRLSYPKITKLLAKKIKESKLLENEIIFIK